MEELKFCEGKKILIVDDEPDVLETLRDLLDMCDIDSAENFETAKTLLESNHYDVAILDIMGVNGYGLLEIAKQKGLSTIMFTANALTADAFVKSMKGGATAYIPKEKMAEIASYVAELLRAQQEGDHRPKKWFRGLKSFFDRQFGEDWLKQYKEYREKFDWLDFDD